MNSCLGDPIATNTTSGFFSVRPFFQGLEIIAPQISVPVPYDVDTGVFRLQLAHRRVDDIIGRSHEKERSSVRNIGPLCRARIASLLSFPSWRLFFSRP